MQKVRTFVRKHPLYSVVIATALFIIVVIAASLYSNAVVWNLFTGPGGVAVGRGGHQSLTQTLVQYDGYQYTHIAQYGYTNVTYRAFLPLYPLVIRVVYRSLHIPVDYAGLIISWVSICAAAVVIYKWAKLELDRRKLKISPWLVLGLIAIFPTAAYFIYPYTESFFLLLNVSALLLYRKKHYAWAGVLASLAALTRFQGLVLLVFFAVDFIRTRKRPQYGKLIAIVLPLIAFGIYMAYLQVHTHNALIFISAEKYWGRFGNNIISNFIHSFRPLYLWFLPVALAGLYAVWYYLGWSYFWYSLVFFLLPMTSGTLLSVNRFMLTLLPMFLAFVIYGQEDAPRFLKMIYVCSSVFLFAWSILLFANGYWVA